MSAADAACSWWTLAAIAFFAVIAAWIKHAGRFEDRNRR